ncbi:MAG: hypothetical protein AB1508_12675 [Pseudomonadota bacterium]
MTEPADDAQHASEKFGRDRLLATIIGELNINQDQLSKRQELIKKIEKKLTEKYKAENKLISYIIRFGHAKAMMSSADIASLASILASVKHADQLNVILHGPGGDGSIVEKMVEMCRDHLPRHSQVLRVIVPNIAKSAATVFALGADKIIMGYCSELGPIDPQVPVVNSGVTQFISAWAYVEAREKLMEKIAEAVKKNEPTVGFLTQLTGLNVPFIQEMENLIHFAEDTATRLLTKYMLTERIADVAQREAKAREIAGKLLSKKLFPIHGHFINAQRAQKDLELDVDILDRTDDLWALIWEYYLRAELQMNIQLTPEMIKIKLFESAEDSIITPEAVRPSV